MYEISALLLTVTTAAALCCSALNRNYLFEPRSGYPKQIDKDKRFILTKRPMKRLGPKISLSVLLISLLISVPSFLAGDHVHESLNEEVSCEFCSHSNLEEALTQLPKPESPVHRTEAVSYQPIAPIETSTLTRKARGPPRFLC